MRRTVSSDPVKTDEGYHVIQVRESAYGGNGACGYRLHVGTFPRPRAVFPAGGQVGQELAVRFIGDEGWVETGDSGEIVREY